MNWICLIALIVSIISLCLTAYKYWRDYKENQLNISVDLKNHFVSGERNVFELNVVNETKNPVSITKIVLIDENKGLKFECIQNKVLLTKGKHIRNESSLLPINLNAYASHKMFIVFDLKQILDIYNFEIYTSKGVYITNYKEKQLKEQPLLNLGSVSINK